MESLLRAGVLTEEGLSCGPTNFLMVRRAKGFNALRVSLRGGRVCSELARTELVECAELLVVNAL